MKSANKVKQVRETLRAKVSENIDILDEGDCGFVVSRTFDKPFTGSTVYAATSDYDELGMFVRVFSDHE